MMKPLSDLPKSKIQAIFTDLDGTLTDPKGMLSSDVYSAIEDLKNRGFVFAIISGRPAGWADCLMRLLPMDAMVFENGAGVMLREGEKIRTVAIADDRSTSSQTKRLEGIFTHLKSQIPNLKLATDQPYRRFDYAIDFAEEPPFLSSEELNLVLKYLQAQPDITAKLSSIHINYWVGNHTKVTACEKLIQLLKLGHRELIKDSILFSGDSPNDEPLFEFFPHSVGVSNILEFKERLNHFPKFVTRQPNGKGFIELIETLLK